jgi:ubiquinone/menaquinone biosynthesis C-methylase UbiE
MAAELEANSTLLDLACGTGAFLNLASTKLRYGLGIDAKESFITFAKKQFKQDNLEFEKAIFTEKTTLDQTYNYISSCLFFHVIPWETALAILEHLAKNSDELIIAAFNKAESKKERLLLFLDQFFNAHYPHFKAYQQNGAMDALIAASSLNITQKIATFDLSISIYKISTNKKTTPKGNL